jgi:hypothetical protein
LAVVLLQLVLAVALLLAKVLLQQPLAAVLLRQVLAVALLRLVLATVLVQQPLAVVLLQWVLALVLAQQELAVVLLRWVSAALLPQGGHQQLPQCCQQPDARLAVGWPLAVPLLGPEAESWNPHRGHCLQGWAPLLDGSVDCAWQASVSISDQQVEERPLWCRCRCLLRWTPPLKTRPRWPRQV